MKHRNFIVGGIVGLLALGVISTSFALFLKKDNDVNIQIGGSVGANGTFKLTKNEDASSSGKLIPGTPFLVQYDLGFTPEEEYTQDIVLGKVSVSLDNSEGLYDNFDISAKIVGYDAGTYFEDTSIVFENYSGAVTIPFSINKETYGTQSLQLTFTLKDSISDETFINSLTEKELKYTINLGDDSEYDMAYVIGNFDDCNWQKSDKYLMVPNIKSQKDTYEWMYVGLDLVEGNLLKCYFPDKNEWSMNNADNFGDGSVDNNLKVPAEKAGRQTIYWKGTGQPVTFGA